MVRVFFFPGFPAAIFQAGMQIFSPPLLLSRSPLLQRVDSANGSLALHCPSPCSNAGFLQFFSSEAVLSSAGDGYTIVSLPPTATQAGLPLPFATYSLTLEVDFIFQDASFFFTDAGRTSPPRTFRKTLYFLPPFPCSDALPRPFFLH